MRPRAGLHDVALRGSVGSPVDGPPRMTSTMTQGTWAMLAYPMLSCMSEKPGPEVAVSALAPASEAPITAPIEAISSSIWMKWPSTWGRRRDSTSAISVEGVMGYPAKKRAPAAIAPSATASLPSIRRRGWGMSGPASGRTTSIAKSGQCRSQNVQLVQSARRATTGRPRSSVSKTSLGQSSTQMPQDLQSEGRRRPPRGRASSLVPHRSSDRLPQGGGRSVQGPPSGYSLCGSGRSLATVCASSSRRFGEQLDWVRARAGRRGRRSGRGTTCPWRGRGRRRRPARRAAGRARRSPG